MHLHSVLEIFDKKHWHQRDRSKNPEKKRANSQSNQTGSYLYFQVRISELVLKRPSADLLGGRKGLYLPIGTSSIVCLSSTVQMILCCFPTSIGIAFQLAITESQLGRDHRRSCQTSRPRQKQHQIQTSQPSVLQLGPKKPHGQRSTSALGNLFPSSTASLPSSPHTENFSVQTDS